LTQVAILTSDLQVSVLMTTLVTQNVSCTNAWLIYV